MAGNAGGEGFISASFDASPNAEKNPHHLTSVSPFAHKVFQMFWDE